MTIDNTGPNNEEFKAFDRVQQMRDMLNSRSNNTLSSKPNLKIDINNVKKGSEQTKTEESQFNPSSTASQNNSNTNQNNLKYSINNVNTILNSNRSP